MPGDYLHPLDRNAPDVIGERVFVFFFALLPKTAGHETRVCGQRV